jgi:hypothetical protein
MRSLKVIGYVTLDGVIDDPNPTGNFKHRAWTALYSAHRQLEKGVTLLTYERRDQSR